MSILQRLKIIVLLLIILLLTLEWSLHFRWMILLKEIDGNATSKFLTSSKQQAHDSPNTVVAYAISITDCPINNSHTVLDGAAVLGRSIHKQSIRASNHSFYDYALYAFVHEDAKACIAPLQELGYSVRVVPLPFAEDAISSSLLYAMEQKGCCGSKEFLKLNVWNLTNHNIAVHLDTDTLLVQPMDDLFNQILGIHRPLPYHHLASDQPAHNKTKVSFDILFTRDYHQQSKWSRNPKHYGVQGGFLVVRPNQTFLEEIIHQLSHEEFHSVKGWSKLGYSGYWGASQIQGYLSYLIGEYYSHRALELNRCLYNSMINDDPYFVLKGTNKTLCRTGESFPCEDCRETLIENIYSIHLTTCRKPWECPYLRPPQQPSLCRTAHRLWFEFRRELDLSFGHKPPQGGWHKEWTLGYCTKPKDSKQRLYLPIHRSI